MKYLEALSSEMLQIARESQPQTENRNQVQSQIASASLFLQEKMTSIDGAPFRLLSGCGALR